MMFKRIQVISIFALILLLSACEILQFGDDLDEIVYENFSDYGWEVWDDTLKSYEDKGRLSIQGWGYTWPEYSDQDVIKYLSYGVLSFKMRHDSRLDKVRSFVIQLYVHDLKYNLSCQDSPVEVTLYRSESRDGNDIYRSMIFRSASDFDGSPIVMQEGCTSARTVNNITYLPFPVLSDNFHFKYKVLR